MSVPAGGTPVTLKSRVADTLYARGVSGITYVFTPTTPWQDVASEDAAALVASGYFRVVS
jgi:hypothetical protein